MDEAGFLDLLTRKNLLGEAAAQRATAASRGTGTSIEKTLMEFGLIEEDALFRALAEFLDLPFYDDAQIASGLVSELALPWAFLERAEMLPAERKGEEIVLALADPRARGKIESVGFHLKLPVTPGIASPSTIKAALVALSQTARTGDDAATSDDIERLNALANEGPVIKLVNNLIAQAVDVGASDIHIEAGEATTRVRFRQDGELRVHRNLPGATRAAVVSRLKIMAKLNISEKRRPQDGRIQVPVRGRNIDIRLSTLPTQFGESIVLRILDRARVKLDWASLGYSANRTARIREAIAAPNGIFLVAGPTGSGKTTTLYTALSEINSDERKIVTVEDPIEYALEGVNQVPVDPAIDMSFARALRAVLRQDPDIIMVGEIRDEETAEIAVRAALVGRLVLSTIHTNDSVSAVTRLIDLGVPAYLVGSTLRGVLSQRLVRRLCLECHGAGCEACGESGVRGRIVVSEYLDISPTLSEAIAAGKTASELSMLAAEDGFETMKSDVCRLNAAGLISISDATAAI